MTEPASTITRKFVDFFCREVLSNELSAKLGQQTVCMSVYLKKKKKSRPDLDETLRFQN